MKLIFCTKCQDVRKLQYEGVTCKCGESGGIYLPDGLNAEFWGPCVLLGFNNFSLADALNNIPETGMGRRFEAFVIPTNCYTAKRKIL